MSQVLIVADHDGETLAAATAKTVTCAMALEADAVEVLVLADRNDHGVAEQAGALAGVDRVHVIARDENTAPTAATAAPQIAAAARQTRASHLLAPNTSFGKDVMPRVAALLGHEMLTDLMHVVSPYRFERPIYAGNAVTVVDVPEDMPVIATVRTASFAAAAKNDHAAPVEPMTIDIALPGHTRVVSRENHAADRLDLASAKRVVTGGRGVGSEENFRIIHDFAKRIGAAVGASRAAVDAGYVPNDMQVGQTGKIIAPELYICFGISGAIQHLAGIKDAGTIVAVNTDPDAPIFEHADIGLVGDLFEVIPALEKALA